MTLHRNPMHSLVDPLNEKGPIEVPVLHSGHINGGEQPEISLFQWPLHYHTSIHFHVEALNNSSTALWIVGLTNRSTMTMYYTIYISFIASCRMFESKSIVLEHYTKVEMLQCGLCKLCTGHPVSVHATRAMHAIIEVHFRSLWNLTPCNSNPGPPKPCCARLNSLEDNIHAPRSSTRPPDMARVLHSKTRTDCSRPESKEFRHMK